MYSTLRHPQDGACISFGAEAIEEVQVQAGGKDLNAHLPQATLLLLAAMAASQLTCLVALTDGCKHTMMRVSGDGDVVRWANLSATAAFSMQASLLTEVQGTFDGGRFKATKAHDMPATLRVVPGLLTKLRSDESPLQEQLDTVLPHVPPQHRLSTAYEVISAHYPVVGPSCALSYFS